MQHVTRRSSKNWAEGINNENASRIKRKLVVCRGKSLVGRVAAHVLRGKVFADAARRINQNVRTCTSHSAPGPARRRHLSRVAALAHCRCRRRSAPTELTATDGKCSWPLTFVRLTAIIRLRTTLCWAINNYLFQLMKRHSSQIKRKWYVTIITFISHDKRFFVYK